MPTLHRYIARLYLTNILILMVVLCGFIVTVDVFINLGRFSRAAAATAQAAEQGGLLHQILLTVVGVVRLWAPRLLQLFSYLNGVILVVAAGFTCAQLVRHRELVAVLASGVSLHRIARPFLLVALAMTLVQALDQEFLVPKVAPLLARDAGDSFKDEVDPFRLRMTPDAEGRLFYAARFENETGTLLSPVIWERARAGESAGEGSLTGESATQGREVVRVVTADRATWDGRGWALENGKAWPPAAFALSSREQSASGGAGGTDGDAGPSGARATTIERVDSQLDPLTIRVRALSAYGESLSIAQLTQVASSGALPTPARERVDRLRWGRVAGWVGNLVTLFAVLPLFLLRNPASMVLASMKATPLLAAGLAASAAGAGLALPGLPVWLGAFVPCLLLVPVAIAMFTGMRT
ncbi:MAG: LptF/LptG family permease [Phycisphaerales bacterium]